MDHTKSISAWTSSMPYLYRQYNGGKNPGFLYTVEIHWTFMLLNHISFIHLSDNASDDVAYPPQVPDSVWCPSSHWVWELHPLIIPSTTSIDHPHLPHGSHDHTRGKKCTNSPSSWTHKEIFQSPQEFTRTVWLRSSSKRFHSCALYILCICIIPVSKVCLADS